MRRVFISLFIFVLLSCGKQAQNPVQVYEITFNENDNARGTLVAEVEGKVISSPAKLNAGTVVSFRATPNEGFEIESWEGVAVQSPNDEKVILTVSENKKVVVNFKAKGNPIEPPEPQDVPDELIIEYLEEDMSCEKPSLLPLVPATNIPSGSKAKVNDKIVFTAKISGTEGVKHWYVNGQVQTGKSEKKFEYTVSKDDARLVNGQYTIKFSMQKKEALPLIIKYDSNAISCKVSGLLGSSVSSGSNVEIGTSLVFTAKLDKTLAVDKWKVNGKDVSSGGVEFTCVVKLEEALEQDDKYVIEVSYSTRTKERMRIFFDKNRLSCNRQGGLFGTGAPILVDEEVEEGEKIVFTAKPGSNEDVKEWLVHGNVKQKGQNTFTYTVDPKDKNSEGKVEVDWTVAYKILIDFDKNTVTCKTKNLLGFWENDIKPNTVFSEGTTLYLYPKLQDDEQLEEWQLNGKKHTTLLGTFIDNITYSVSNSDAIDKNGKRYIRISIKVKRRPKALIRFDSAKIKCMKGEREVNSEESVIIGSRLLFTLKLPEDKAAQEWQINGRRRSVGVYPRKFAYVLDDYDAVNEGDKRLIHVTIVEKDLKQVTITYDPNKIECKKEDDSEVISGTKLYEETTLILTAKLASDESVSKWITGKTTLNKSTSSITYNVKAKDATGNDDALTINFSFETKENVVIAFDPNNISCQVDRGSFPFSQWDAVYNGDAVVDGARIWFEVKGSAVPNEWHINGQKYKGAVKSFYYTVDASKAQLVDGKKQILVEIK